MSDDVVMAGLVPAIHALLSVDTLKT